jgi:hypothetical protein
MALIEMHLESFGNELELVAKSLNEDSGVPSGFDDLCLKGSSRNIGVPSDLDEFCPKGFTSSSDNLLNLRKRFLIHNLSPFLKAAGSLGRWSEEVN